MKDENHLNHQPDDKQVNEGHRGSGNPAIKERRLVHVKCDFLRIEDVNTIVETFTGSCVVKARWREPRLDLGDRGRPRAAEEVIWDKLWDPKLEVNNLIGTGVVQLSRELRYNLAGECDVIETRRVKGVYTEKMELELFPFDAQDLSILVTSDLEGEEVGLVEEEEEEQSRILTENFVDVQEWTLYDFVTCIEREVEVQQDFSTTVKMKPGLYFRCVIKRKSGFFVSNIIFIMAIITGLSFVTFSVDKDMPESRLQMVFLLLLAGVTFKFAANQSVPKISYLTILDKYILGSMVFLACVAVNHAVIAVISRNDEDENHTLLNQFELIELEILIALYVGVNAAFAIYVMVKGRQINTKMRKKEQEYKTIQETKATAAKNRECKK